MMSFCSSHSNIHSIMNTFAMGIDVLARKPPARCPSRWPNQTVRFIWALLRAYEGYRLHAS